jgi:hypothetical protein
MGTCLAAFARSLSNRQQCHLVTTAKLQQERVDGANLHTASSTGVSNLGDCDMILAVGLNQRECAESLDDCVLRRRTTESLQQFLENQARNDDRVCAIGCFAQGNDFLGFNCAVTTQCQGSDTGVYKKRHDLERSAL